MRRYSDEFKLAAVRLSQEPGIQVQTVAAALAIHPFMLSKWRKDARDGRLAGATEWPSYHDGRPHRVRLLGAGRRTSR